MLEFDDATHTYKWDGVTVPSVTQVLEDVGIIDYSRIPEDTREAALARGSRVHLATAFDDEYHAGICADPLDEDSICEIDRPYIDAWRRFRDEKHFHLELVEHRVWNPQYRYAGTLDRTGWFEARPATKILLDLKTGTAEPWVRAQLAAYTATFPHPRTLTRVCVELKKTGDYNCHVFEPRDFQADLNVFLYALGVYNFKREKRRMAA